MHLAVMPRGVLLCAAWGWKLVYNNSLALGIPSGSPCAYVHCKALRRMNRVEGIGLIEHSEPIKGF